jgi:carbon storage regulator
MPILTRRPNESVTIGNDIVVKVIAIKGNQVRIGIEARRRKSRFIGKRSPTGSSSRKAPKATLPPQFKCG